MASFECYRCLRKFENKNKVAYCPICGRKMISGSYDRKTMLIKDVKNLLLKLKFPIQDSNSFDVFNIIKKEKHFPTFFEIINASKKFDNTTKYLDFLQKAVNNIGKYVSSNSTAKKYADLTLVNTIMQIYDKELKRVLNDIKIKENIEKVEIPNMQGVITFSKKTEFLDASKEIIELLNKLLKKMSQHIHTFSIFGFNSVTDSNIFEDYKISSSNKILDDCINYINQVLDKKIVFDFFNDGLEDYSIMDCCVWHAFYVLLNVCNPNETYYFEKDKEKVEITQINDLIQQKYVFLDEINKDESFMIAKSDEEIIEYYDFISNVIEKSRLGINMDYKPVGKHEKELHKLIGLDGIKETVKKINAYIQANKKKNKLNIHMCFLGNPGTGKTEVARIIAGILHENGVLPTSKVIETDRSGMVGEYVGETPQKVNAIIEKAMGGVLFIDEAYSLVPKDASFDYGHEAVATLIKAMEDYRGKFCVILAGYKNEMNKMLDSNPGFKSRIQFTLDFPNYSRDELKDIAHLMLNKYSYNMDEIPMNRMLDILDVKRKDENFANAREVRNILEQVIMNQNLRCLNSEQKDLTVLDVDKYIVDNKILLPKANRKHTSKILTADEELEQLIGLEGIKKSIRKIRAFAKKNKGNENFNVHMCFYGNPGTGKTEVARIISRLLYDANVLESSKLIETDKTGLVGKYTGETGLKTKDLLDKAMDGVLFIDEAYQICDDSDGGGFGKEAISVLLKGMEDYRGRFCVIMAGYREEMKQMIAVNPGLKSRIQFELDFPDYSREELSLIAKKFLKSKDYNIDDDALERILDVSDYYRQLPDFANARTIRNIVDHVIMNQVLRVEDLEDDFTIKIEDVEEYIEENGINIATKKESNNPINNQAYEILKYEITTLPGQYNFFNRNIINFDYINESVVCISGNDSQGTGFIISPTGLCLTCAHCVIKDGVSQKARVLMKSYDGKIMKFYNHFKVIKIDYVKDIALIKLDNIGLMYKYLPLSNENFEFIPLLSFYVAGYPFGGESFEFISYSEGKIASTNYYDNRKVVFADMFGQPGSSGSPIIDKQTNNVIGLYFGGIGQNDSKNMINCFIPIDEIWKFINSIL